MSYALLVSDANAAEAPAETTSAIVAAPEDELPPPPVSPLSSFVPLILIFIIMYFLLIRPQQKRIKTHQQMIGALKRGDRVVTGGGIIGTVVKLEGDDILQVEVAPNIKVRVARDTISQILAGDKGTVPSANDN